MLGLMQKKQLLISSILTHAAAHHGEQEIVSNTIEGGMHRYTYADAEKRIMQLANALVRLGVKLGDRVGTLAWNGYRHFEIYYATSGIGSICHTINPRLFPEQVAYIVNHAADQYIFIDLNLYPLVEALGAHLKTVKGVVVMTDKAHMPDTAKLSATIPVHCYETLIADEPETIAWPDFDENTASSLCYTSGTTGNPKGVLYSHRSTLLHAYATHMTDSSPLGAADCVLPVVPMFHVNAWGVPYSALMSGTKIVFPGIQMDGGSLTKMMNDEKVTCSLGVPTIWLGLLQHLRESGQRLETVKRFLIGGAACPLAIIEGFGKEYDISVVHGWGMTELSPVGTINAPKAGMEKMSADEKYRHQLKQGRALFGYEMKVIDDDGNALPHDGKSFGRLMSRGYWVVSEYFNDDENPDGILDDDNWFDTGDVATIDERGYMQITDRTKDVIKSGGEWIGSIDLENVALSHPAVAQAAVIGIPHPKWDERPLLIVVKKPGAEVTREDLLSFYDGKIAKWMVPDDVAFVDEIPLGATGKILKTKLREQFADYKLPTA
ncbi:MAG: 3-(methylthio)propionyl-CoA ligase [Rhodospirillales bacterium]|nr:3-(methylthio)propionyl-CoA ligase [Rhodospirillales bacterium]MCW8861115.1 3-(methylthio)propionyl-CoA ligase [Rhodospirillales bacterium]MCW8970216.1 3-(methylthio)propionyl-CoA ligase [Rhodospirillales bacterium]MCW9003147.1 3-(methylthio)propionyl-CoA ligase [Rhodospirillales bacterium]